MPRLNEVLKVLNVGVNTVAEVLQKKGKPLAETTPSAMITDEQYELLMLAFVNVMDTRDALRLYNEKHGDEKMEDGFKDTVISAYKAAAKIAYRNEIKGQRGIWVSLVSIGTVLAQSPSYKKGNLLMRIKELGTFDCIDSEESDKGSYWIKPKEAGLVHKEIEPAEPTSSTKEWLIPLTDDPENDKVKALSKLREVAINPEGWSNKKVNQLKSVFIISHNNEKKKALQEYLSRGGGRRGFHIP